MIRVAFKGCINTLGPNTAWLRVHQSYPEAGPEVEIEMPRERLPKGHALGQYLAISVVDENIHITLQEYKWTADEIEQARESARRFLSPGRQG